MEEKKKQPESSYQIDCSGGHHLEQLYPFDFIGS